LILKGVHRRCYELPSVFQAKGQGQSWFERFLRPERKSGERMPHSKNKVYLSMVLMEKVKAVKEKITGQEQEKVTRQGNGTD
jgi:hypothetical protein